MQRLQDFWQMPRLHKRIVSVAIDTLMIGTAFHLALWVRLGEFTHVSSPFVWGLQAAVTLLTVFVFARLGLYRSGAALFDLSSSVCGQHGGVAFSGVVGGDEFLSA